MIVLRIRVQFVHWQLNNTHKCSRKKGFSDHYCKIKGDTLRTPFQMPMLTPSQCVLSFCNKTRMFLLKLIIHAWMLWWLCRLQCSSLTVFLEWIFSLLCLSCSSACLNSVFYLRVCVCVCVLQVPRCSSRQRQLPTDWPAALWPHLHRLPWPAADEATHGTLTQETQVSGWALCLCALLYLRIFFMFLCVCQQFPRQACSFIGCIYGLIIAGNKVYMSLSKCLTVTQSAC